jgi:hypothetical protein
MKIASIIVAISLAIAVIWLAWMRSKRSEIGSFWDVVRNPNAMPDLDQFHQEVNNAAATLAGSPAKISQLVDYFVFDAKSSDDAWTEKRTLAKLGTQAYPRALEILRDPSLKERLVELSNDSDALLAEAPINRLCDLFDLDAPPPEEAAPLLAPYLQSDSEEIRKDVALILGSIASVESLPALRRALVDQDEYVRSYALMGIERAINGGRVQALAKGEIFQAVAAMWPEDTSHTVGDRIPSILLKLDRELAMDFLLDNQLFTIQFPRLYCILEAFNQESVEVPRARLLAILKDAGNQPLQFPIDYVFQEALPLLAAHRNHEDLATFERLLNDKNKHVVRGAIEALRQFHREDKQIRDLWKVVDESGWDALTDVEKQIYAIQLLDMEVNNGGFAQYYFNSSGDSWQDALSGLDKIGAVQRHQLMLATLEKFIDSSPSQDRDKRMSQLSQIARKHEDPFNRQDNAWYEIEDENLELLIFKHNLRHAKGQNQIEPMGER